jgi:hypothetical protein
VNVLRVIVQLDRRIIEGFANIYKLAVSCDASWGKWGKLCA